MNQAADARKPKAGDMQEEQWTMKVKDEWMDRLLQYDYISCKFLILDNTVIHLHLNLPISFRQKGPWSQQPSNF